mgnify:CR=1 FL=1
MGRAAQLTPRLTPLLTSRLTPLLTSLLLGFGTPAAFAQQDGREPVQHPVLAPKPTDDAVEQVLESVKASILPRCWDDRCDEDESRRRKYLAKWQAVVSEHYVVFTNGPTATCRKYATTLEDLYEQIRKELPFEDPKHLLVAYIFADKDDYYRFAVRVTGYSEEGAKATAGHATSRFYATYYSSPRAPVVYHEAAHEIVGACLKVNGVGSWFQEGMAVYFEKKMSNQRLGVARSDVKRGDYYPLEEFFAIRTLLSDPKGHGRRNYEHAGDLIDFMINTDEAPVAGKFGEFLEAARTHGHGFARGGDTSATLIEKVYGLTVDEFESVWFEHMGIRRRS